MKSSVALAAAALVVSASAHSWIEYMSVISGNGTFVGEPGYPRAFAKRAAGVDPDKAMVHLIPPNGRPTGNKILDSDPMCMQSQQQPKQSDGSPMLNAAAGDMVAVRYQENGHVTLPQNQPGKPANRGTVYIYGTTNPSPDAKFLSIHKVWNADGTGGDKKGKLLATEPFDDGQCYQMNGGKISTQRQSEFKHQADPTMGQDLWCQNNFKIPQDAPDGKPFTVYWVWDWDTAPGTAGQPAGLLEKYTTCMDISVSKKAKSQSHAAGTQFSKGQDLNKAAIPSYVKQLAAGDNIFVPGSEPGSKHADDAAPSDKPAASSQAPASAKPAVPSSSQSAAAAATPPAAGQATVTVTAQAPPAQTVTVTAGAAQQSSAATPSTTLLTTHSTVYVTRSSSKPQTQTVPANAAGTTPPAQPSAAAAQPQTVSGVVIPTMSISRFTGTATAITPAQTNGAVGSGAPAPSGAAGTSEKRCASCKPAKRSTIFGGDGAAKHVEAHKRGSSLRKPGSAKFRGV
ncbi:MAG: hypothetical protein Q9222_007342 [Ikaeria aurantiellina]